MNCCCQNILELCRVAVCGESEIVTGANATQNGNYKLVLSYLGNEVVINQELEVDEPLNFPSNGLNERYKYTGNIIGPDGEPVSLTVGEEVFDCISFQTGLSYNLTEAL